MKCVFCIKPIQVHTHLEQWAADNAAPGKQLGVQCLAQGSHLSHGQFLPEPRFEPTTSGYKSNALSIRPRLPHVTVYIWWVSIHFCDGLNLLTERKLKWQKATSLFFVLFVIVHKSTYSETLIIRQYVFKVDSAGIRKRLKWSVSLLLLLLLLLLFLLNKVQYYYYHYY